MAATSRSIQGGCEMSIFVLGFAIVIPLIIFLILGDE